MACYGLKKGSFHLFRHPKWSTIIFGKTLLGPIFDPILVAQNNPFSRHFVTLEGPKWLAMGSKGAHFTCSGTPNGLASFLEKHIFDPLLTHFLSQNSPVSRHFGIFGGPWATISSKRAKNTCSVYFKAAIRHKEVALLHSTALPLTMFENLDSKRNPITSRIEFSAERNLHRSDE